MHMGGLKCMSNMHCAFISERSLCMCASRHQYCRFARLAADSILEAGKCRCGASTLLAAMRLAQRSAAPRMMTLLLVGACKTLASGTPGVTLHPAQPPFNKSLVSALSYAFSCVAWCLTHSIVKLKLTFACDQLGNTGYLP